MNHFPTYQPSEERIAEVAKQYAEENNPLNLHYDASREVRAKGAGFYQFSGDEETRKAQMAELKASRDETTKTRQELGAEDIMPGQEEGMTADGVESRAMEKRKREVEDRRQMVEAKRRKLQALREARQPSQTHTPSNTQTESLSYSRVSSQSPQKLSATFTDPFSVLEAQSSAMLPSKASAVVAAKPFDALVARKRRRLPGSRLSSQSPQELLLTSTGPFSAHEAQASTIVGSKASTAPADPFAALGARKPAPTMVNDNGKNKALALTPNETDTFLAELETEFLGSRTSK